MGKILGYYIMPHPPILIPEIGKGEEEKIKDTFNSCVKIAQEIKNLNPDTIIIITPHGPVFSDAMALSYEESIYGDLGKFGEIETQFNLDIDLPLTNKILDNAQKKNILTAKINSTNAKNYGIKYELDHGCMVPLYFINKEIKDFKIVHITYGMIPKLQLYKFGMCIKEAVKESNTNAVFITSGDLSHRLKEDGPYEYSPYGKKFDEEILSLLKKGDVNKIFNMDNDMIEQAGECGLKSIYTMVGAMDGYDVKGNLLSYENTFGVGYGVMTFELKENNKNTLQELIKQQEKIYNKKIENSNPYTMLARESLTHYLIHGNYIDVPAYTNDDMKNTKTGVFVSIKKFGNLRGCIGTVFPTTENIAKEIIRNAVEAGLSDPRFPPIREEELKDLDFSVDVLTKPIKANKEELDPKKYGVIVRSDIKCGLLLPNLEGVNTIEEQLSIALQKGGIDYDENYTIEKFEVIRYK